MSPGPEDEAGSHNTELEGRLRGLILNNARTQSSVHQPASKGPAFLPPHQGGSFHNEGDVKDCFTPAEPAATSQGPRQATQSLRKRPNQAQRRQMSSVLSIPIDGRPAYQRQQPSRGFSRQTGFPAHHYGPQDRGPYHGQAWSYEDSQSFQNQAVTPNVFHQPTQMQQRMHIPMHPPHVQQYRGGHQFFPGRLESRSSDRSHPTCGQGQHGSENTTPHGQGPALQQDRLYQPGPYNEHGRNLSFDVTPTQLAAQTAFLDVLVNHYISLVQMEPAESRDKEDFRQVVEQICRDAISVLERQDHRNENFDPTSVELKYFGSMASSFATKSSDMDLALLTPYSEPPADSSESPIPRLIERKLLDAGYGARLLTRTRVPIIKLCQKPTAKLISDLLEERKKFDNAFTPEFRDQDDGDGDYVRPSLEGNDTVCGTFVKKEVGYSGNSAMTVYEARLALLQQRPKQSLDDYYKSAKRVLWELGGRDITAKNYTPTSPEKSKILTDVCEAFLNGLYDESLKARLCSYPSLTFSSIDPPTKLCSLNRIYTQMEGELLVVTWESRQLKEVHDKSEAEYGRWIEDWKVLMNRTDLDESTYDKMLRNTCEKLKKLLMPQLPSSEQSLQQRILQLADDYETALERNIYDEDRFAVECYIALLRQSGVSCTTELPAASESIDSLRINASNAPLIAAMRTLPVPSQMSQGRERHRDKLEFPKDDVGVQCDINFSAHLALQNTKLLRCYSLTDHRVRPIIIFVKHWAKLRGINSSYHGTLSSYGYVLMVLHYLVNVAQPFVSPNLQQLHRDLPPYQSPRGIAAETTCNGYDVRFWRNEEEIAMLAERGMLNHNQESCGSLLRGFFEYYARAGPLSTGNGQGFNWMRDVLSLRTTGGILTKQEKGWTSVKYTMMTMAGSTTNPSRSPVPSSVTPNVDPSSFLNAHAQAPPTGEAAYRKPKLREGYKEVRHRYLLCIEDPFEIDHNVARTVNHSGIVAIRDEFRRAWNIITQRPGNHGGLMDDVDQDKKDKKKELLELMDLIHGKEVAGGEAASMTNVGGVEASSKTEVSAKTASKTEVSG